ncbi:MAG: ATP-binding protein [Gammaproteobacteria bacterium]
MKIRHKLFLAILLANVLFATSVYLLANWAFSNSFRDYLDQTEAKRLAPLVQGLADIYSSRKNWRWVRNRDDPTWSMLMREHSPGGPPPRQRPGLEEPGFDGYPPPPPEPRAERLQRNDSPRARRPGLLLQNAKRKLVIGRPADQSRVYWIPIELEDTTVGYLGFIRRLNISSDLDLLFASRIKSNFAWMVLGILLISAIISIPLARIMVRPIEKLRHRAHQLASGNYQLSPALHSNDEIGELGKDFNILAETLTKNLSARQQWIADISHELRTPVAVLQGEIEAIQDGIRELTRESITSLHQEIVRLSALVNDLHELSLSDMGALSTRKAKFNIVELVDSVIQQFRSSLEHKSIIIKLNASSDNIIVDGDYQRLEQLFVNLAINSRHYTQSPGTVTVTISKQNQQVIITWSDSAPGVMDADLSRLFERLYRVDSSRNSNTGGSGLGLAICQNIVKANQGSIKAEHSPLGGVSIVITLPLVES